MRHLFLFNDAILCTARLTNAAGVKQHATKAEYEFEWFAPLLQLSSIHHVENELRGDVGMQL